MVAIDGRAELDEAIVAEAVQTEIRSALDNELIDVERAAAILDMTEGAQSRGAWASTLPAG